MMVLVVSIVKNDKESFQKAMSTADFVGMRDLDEVQKTAGKNKNAHKKILVVLEDDDLSKQILQYALSLCKRMGGHLEVLHKQGPREGDITKTKLWQEFTKKEEQVVYSSLGPEESLDDKLIEYGKTRHDILCVVLRIDLMDRKSIKKSEERAWSPDWLMQKLNCPVMVYS